MTTDIYEDDRLSPSHIIKLAAMKTRPRRRSSLIIAHNVSDEEEDSSWVDSPHTPPQIILCTKCRSLSSSPISASPVSPYGIPPPTRNKRLPVSHSPLVGSYEESLFSRRMSSQASSPISFYAKIGVHSTDSLIPVKFSSQISIPFGAVFYQDQKASISKGSPFVGLIDIDDYYKKKQYGYRIPKKGQVQIVVSNPQNTAVHLFLIPYDLSSMPINYKTFIRQRSMELNSNVKSLVQAIHLQVACVEGKKPGSKRLYIYGDIRIVFQNRLSEGLPAYSSKRSVKVETVKGDYGTLKSNSTKLTCSNCGLPI
jgi:hypothetical protein